MLTLGLPGVDLLTLNNNMGLVIANPHNDGTLLKKGEKHETQ